jgi:SNF2 family DNA or RNA helicase
MSLYETVLFDYQREAVDRIVARRSILLADQPGLGKTVEVLSSLEQAGLFDKPDAMILVLAPVVAVQSAWRDSIEKWVAPNHRVGVVDLSYGTAKKREDRLDSFLGELGQPRVVLANHAVLEVHRKNGARFPALFEQVWDAVIIDESHVVLPISNDRKLTNFWLGLKSLRVARQGFRLAVSGTPDRGKLENRYGTYKFLRPDDFVSVNRWAWLETNFFVSEQKVARGRVVKVVGAVKSKASWAVTEDSIIVRRTKAEVLKDLPPKQYNFVELELYPEQRQDYMSQVRVMTEKKLEADDDGVETAAAMVFALRARQIAACQWSDGKPVVGGKSAKLDWLLEWLAEREGVKVVVCSQFAQVLRWLESELVDAGYSVGVLDGGVSASGRASVQAEFQRGALQVCLISGRMGVGITLDVADDLIMFDLPYDPDVVEQVEDRVHRASRNHQVTIWNLLAIGSIDQLVAKKLNSRYFVTRASMDGRRGIDFEKNVIDRLRVGIKMSDPVDSVSVIEGETNG